MEKDAKSFFEKLFTTRHIGRVIDFFLFEAASFLDRAADSVEVEKRVRAAFEMLVFASWAYFRKNEISKWVELEVGWDKNKLVLSVVSYLEPGLSGFFPTEPAQPNTPAASAIRSFLSEVQKISNGLMVRYHPGSGRSQFVVIFLPTLSGNFKTEYLDLSQATPDQIAMLTPLRDAPTALSAARVEDFVASENKATEPHQAPKARDSEDSFKSEIEKINQDLVRIQGSKENIKDEIIRVKGGTSDANEEKVKKAMSDVSTVKSDAEEIGNSVQLVMNSIRGDLVEVTKGMNEDQFQELNRKIAENVRENYGQTLHHLLRVRSISAVSKVKALKAELEETQEKLQALQNQTKLEKGTASEADTADAKSISINKIAEKQDGKFKEVMSKYNVDLESGKIPAAAQEWAKGFMEEMMKERAQFNERVQEVERYLRKKEHEYKVQFTAVQEQLRLKEEDSKQKEFNLRKTKESLSAAMSGLERYKAQTHLQGDQAALSHKLFTSEKLLNVAKDNNERLAKRLEESQARWNSEFSSRSAAQQDLSKANRKIEELSRQLEDADPSKTEAAAKAQNTKENEATQRVIESLKKQIKELQSKLTAAVSREASNANAGKGKNAVSEADVSQLKFKLEHSNKVIKSMKDELDRYKKRFDELKSQETKLKVEISKLQAQVKTAGSKAMAAATAAQNQQASATFGKPGPRKPGSSGG